MEEEMNFSVGMPELGYCGPIKKRKKKLKTHIHFSPEGCGNFRHSHFPKDIKCYYSASKKPAWYYTCEVPYFSDEKNVKVLKLFKFFGLVCSCTPGHKCDACMGVMFSRRLAVGIDLSIDIDFLIQLESFIDFEKIDAIFD